ncbi:hypothetical protein SAMN02910369_01379 [Lachnospiraceae bacterium NE2001]|nr:hypothetical protein SAMN02910369_01379 [Lachnospiraceae bacterium NE2001]
MNKKGLSIVLVGYLVKYPPVLSFIQAATDLGYHITVFAAGNNSDMNSYKGYNFKKVNFVDVIGEYESNIALPLKMLRMEKIHSRLWNILSTDQYKNDVIVAVSEISVKHLGMRLLTREYILYQLELVESFDLVPHSKLLRLDEHKMGKGAKAVIVCEYNRAHITKTWWKLDTLPYILKNKPYLPDETLGDLPEHILSIQNEIINKAKGRKIVLYQGVVNKQRPVDKIVKVLGDYGNEYFSVLMSDTNPVFNNETPLNYMYVPFVEPPYHLAVTSLAHIGLLMYVPGGRSSYSELNPVYCAPNKIWEYAKFGVPMIGNDNPGLQNEFEKNGIGLCMPSINEEDVIDTINQVESKYTMMKRNTIHFYKNYDVKTVVEKILNESI